jgi:hypothetical protein
MSLAQAAGARAVSTFRVKTYNAISPVGLQVYDSQYSVSPVRGDGVLQIDSMCA